MEGLRTLWPTLLYAGCLINRGHLLLCDNGWCLKNSYLLLR